MQKTVRTGVLLLGCLTAMAVGAQTGNTFQIKKSVMAAGGGQSSGSNFSLKGTVGQSVASQTSSGSIFSVAGGFWVAGANQDIIFKNGFQP